MNQRLFILICSMIFIFSSCARSTSDLTLCISGHVYGFWAGLWHGLIAPFDLLGSLFNPEIKMFAPNNNGGWYALGFLFGSGGWGVLANQGARKRK
ncbi:MAG: hypothetical protein ABI761_04180 [Saprospiraceae bacterium]